MSNETKPTELIYGKLATIQGALTGIVKTGEANFVGKKGGRVQYSYFEEATVMSALKPLLAKHNVAAIPTVADYHRQGNCTIVDLELKLVCGDDGSSVVFRFPNEGVDDGDKGFNRAYTGAMKYLLQKAFLIPTDLVDEQEAADTPAVRTAPAKSANGIKPDQATQLRQEFHNRKLRVSDIVHLFKSAGIPLRTPGDSLTVSSINLALEALTVDEHRDVLEYLDSHEVKGGEYSND